ncbi:MAG: amino acid ABC transporter permease [Spirochaetales bacterium]|nr:amino acid ABC transporter permease [Spirochaetales bacterium]
MGSFDLTVFLRAFRTIMRGLPVTALAAVAAMAAALVLGTLIALVRRSPQAVGKRLLTAYVSFFRGTPLMVQLFLFYFGLPQLFPALSTIGPLGASILVMSLNGSAYVSEAVRSSLASVDPVQMEAALSVGMGKSQAMARIVLPQAFRIAVPPLGNTFIGLIQGTALTFMLGLRDVMGMAKMGAAASYRFFEFYLAVGLVYWLLAAGATWFNRRLEMRLSLGHGGHDGA